MTPSAENAAGLCDMCVHPTHGNSDCGVVLGYDHLNGDHECGCPGSLADQLAQAWEEGYEAAREVVDFEGEKVWAHTIMPDGYRGNPYVTPPGEGRT